MNISRASAQSVATRPTATKTETQAQPASAGLQSDSVELSPMYILGGVGTVLGAASGIGASLGGTKGMLIGAAVAGATVGGAVGFLDSSFSGEGTVPAVLGAAATIGVASAALGGVGLLTSNPLLTSVAAGTIGLGGVGLAISLLG